MTRARLTRIIAMKNKGSFMTWDFGTSFNVNDSSDDASWLSP